MKTTKIFTITGMHCSSCAMNIDGELEDTGKIVDVKTNYAKGKTEVTFNTEEISVKEIIDTIKNAGYTATVSN